MPSIYPRHCKCCDYVANNAVLWSKHCLTIKHNKNSNVNKVNNVNNVINVNDTNQLLKIIEKQNEKIIKQNNLILKLLGEMDEMEETNNINEIDEINPFIDNEPNNITIDINEEEEEEQDDICNIEDIFTHKKFQPDALAMFYEEDKTKYSRPSSTLTNYFIKTINNMRSDKRPIKVIKDKLYYKSNGKWINGNNKDIEKDIDSIYHKFRTTAFTEYKTKLNAESSLNLTTALLMGNFNLFDRKTGFNYKDLEI